MNLIFRAKDEEKSKENIFIVTKTDPEIAQETDNILQSLWCGISVPMQNFT